MNTFLRVLNTLFLAGILVTLILILNNIPREQSFPQGPYHVIGAAPFQVMGVQGGYQAYGGTPVEVRIAK